MDKSITNSLLNNLYDLDIDTFRKMYDLKDISDSKSLCEALDIYDGILLGTSKNINTDILNSDDLVVVGGPCICYCESNYDKISFQDYIDIIYPMTVAKRINKPCIIYLQIHEAFLQELAITGKRSLYSDWNKLRSLLEKRIRLLGNKIGLDDKQLFIISTDIEKIKKQLDLLCDDLNNNNVINQDILDGMYSINCESNHPHNSPLKDIFYNVYERNIAVYFIDFIKNSVDLDFSKMLIVENSTQLKAIRLAEIISKQYNEANDYFYIACYMSTPGIKGHEMSQSFDRDKILLCDCKDAFDKKLCRANDNIIWYYRKCLSNVFFENMLMFQVENIYKNMNNAISVCFAADNNYVQYLRTAVYSLICNRNKNICYDIIILHSDITDKNIENITSLFSKQDNVTIRFIDISEIQNMFNYVVESYYSSATLYRLFLFSSLFDEYDRIVYIDSDVIVLNDLEDLYNVDLDDCLIGAVDDIGFKQTCYDKNAGILYDGKLLSGEEYYKEILKLNSINDYFNAGVITLDLKKCREKYSFTDVIELLHCQRYTYNDQDVLNILFESKVKKLDCKWNYQNYLEDFLLKEKGKYNPELLEMKRNNYNIIHYVGESKPWNSKVSLGDFYYQYNNKINLMNDH